jgi:hypothetical protein
MYLNVLQLLFFMEEPILSTLCKKWINILDVCFVTTYTLCKLANTHTVDTLSEAAPIIFGIHGESQQNSYYNMNT